MITPVEIQEKEFSRGLKGFKEEEVNEFLDQLTLDMEALLNENQQLREENEQLKQGAAKYQQSENSVLQTLETAKGLMNDISASAEKRAQILLKNAELDAQRIQREARESAARITEEYAAMRNRLNGFRRQYRELLTAELQRFETASSGMAQQMGMDVEDLADIPEAAPGKKVRLRAPKPEKPARQAKPAGRPADDRKKTMVHIK